MKLRINGIETDNYLGDLSFLSEFKEGFENIIPIDTNDFVIGTEANLVWEVAKTAARASKDVATGVYKAQKEAGRHIKDAREHWNSTIKPAILRVLKEFQIQLQNMWAKYMKYDQKYKALGKEINSVINVLGKATTSFPRTKLSYHAFDVNTLVGYFEIVKDYDTFMKNIISNKSLFPNGMVGPKEFGQIIERNDVVAGTNAVNALTEGVGNLNKFGELGMVKVFWEDKRSGINIFSKFDNNLLKAAVEEKASMTEFVEGTILRGLVNKTYDTSNINEFREDMLRGNGSYLQVMRNMLNNNIIANMLTKGGDSIKKRTKEELSNMETLVKMALDKQMKSQNKTDVRNSNKPEEEQKEQRKPNFTDSTSDQLKNEQAKAEAQTKADKGEESMEAFSDFFKETTDNSNEPTAEKGDVKDRYEGQYSPDSDPTSIVEVADNYIQAYTLLMAKASGNYSSIVRGALSATYTLIKETTQIVAFLKTASTDPKYGQNG